MSYPCGNKRGAKSVSRSYGVFRLRNSEGLFSVHVWPAAEETAKALTAAEETDKAAGAESAEAFEGLTPEERGVVLRYAVGDPEIRKTIIAEYLREVKAGAERAAPRVLSGSEGATPVLPPRNPRSLYEAGQIAEAIFSRS